MYIAGRALCLPGAALFPPQLLIDTRYAIEWQDRGRGTLMLAAAGGGTVPTPAANCPLTLN